MRLSSPVFAVLLLLAAAAGCGSSQGAGGGAGGGGGGDGKVHPPGNGQRESESDACKALSDAQSSKSLSAGCLSTAATCPDFLRSQTGTACLQYDAGSVQGCIDLYDQQTTCDALSSAVANCVPVSFSGSAPDGC